jgi:CO/xanthine dehydrogenase Mo-binding subunit
MSLVGTDVTMGGGMAKVTGAVNYAPDLVLPRMLHAKALRSPYPHAKLLHVDASKAEKYPGVVAVVTHEDLSGLNPYSDLWSTINPLWPRVVCAMSVKWSRS